MNSLPLKSFPLIARDALPAGTRYRCAISWCPGPPPAASPRAGCLIGFSALGSPAMAQALLPLAPFLFLAGALGGVAHGAVLAYVGRPHGTSRRRPGLLGRAPAHVPALMVAWVATAWISLTSAVFALHAPPRSCSS